MRGLGPSSEATLLDAQAARSVFLTTCKSGGSSIIEADFDIRPSQVQAFRGEFDRQRRSRWQQQAGRQQEQAGR